MRIFVSVGAAMMLPPDALGIFDDTHFARDFLPLTAAISFEGRPAACLFRRNAPAPPIKPPRF